jgi:hypothetical protein
MAKAAHLVLPAQQEVPGPLALHNLVNLQS